MTIPVSTASKETSLKASKWLHVRMLLTPEELSDLLNQLGECYFVNIAKICKKDEVLLSTSTVLSDYTNYLDNPKDYRNRMSVALSKDLSPFYLIQVQENSVLCKLKTPAVRMQAFDFVYVAEQKEFFMSHSLNATSWGIEFSFPQFYEDPVTKAPIEIFKDKLNPNTILFKALQGFSRNFTKPAAFLFQGEKIIAPFRIGKKVINLVSHYESLKQVGLEVVL